MKKINLAISGCMGRMGQQLIKSSRKNKNFKLVTLTENRLINKKFNGVKPELNSDKAFKKTDVIIEQSYSERQLFEKAYERLKSEFEIILGEKAKIKIDKALRRIEIPAQDQIQP